MKKWIRAESGPADTSVLRKKRAAGFAIVILLTAVMMFSFTAAADECRKLTYSVYPFLPDITYYEEILEEEWKKLNPDVSLEYVPYNCYTDGRPEGIDVIMYNIFLEKFFIENDYIRPFDVRNFIDTDDFYAFTLEPAEGYADNYGVPIFLCSDLLIYDRDNRDLSQADSIFDVAASDSKVLISFKYYGDSIYILDAAADIMQDPQVIQDKDEFGNVDVSKSRKALADAAVPVYTDTESKDIPGLYDAGIADGYIGYSESMRDLRLRQRKTEVKQIAMGSGENIPLFYCDMAGISADVPDDRLDLCRDLIRIMADKEVMKRVSVKDGTPQYLLFPRISFYDEMEKEYPMYAKLGKIAGNDKNRLFRVYGTSVEEIFGK